MHDSISGFFHTYMSKVQMLKATLSVYMEDQGLPLPTCEEVLVCNESTSEEEVNSQVFIRICVTAFNLSICIDVCTHHFFR